MITVYITTWHVPFAQTVQAVATFKTEAEAVTFINAEATKFWAENDGDRSVAEGHTDEGMWSPVTELGYDNTRIELWGGESGFDAMLDAATYARLHNAHYAGKPLPGYLINAYAAGHKPGGSTPDEIADYDAKARDGLATVIKHYSK